MSVQDNKLVDRRFYEEVMNTGNVALVEQFFATHIEDMQQWVTRLHRAFAGLYFTIEEQIGEGNKLVTRWTATGIHIAAWEGFAPTNQLVKWTGTTTQRYSNGKVVELWAEVDRLGLRQQLGLKVVPTLVTQQ